MIRPLLILLLLALPACREETAAIPQPLEATAQTVGYFCQMNVLEHSGPKGQIHLEGLPGAPLFFSQVRDVVAYLRLPEQSHRILATYVNDMGAAPSWSNPGTGNWVLIDKVVFVVGSNMMGGMDAPELIPFTDPAKAHDFTLAHGGSVMNLADIPDADIFTAPETETDADDPDYSARLRALSPKAGG